jgi:hypothetical protein
MNIQKELKKWADKTANGYVSIASEFGEDAPSFYTQSDLTKLLDFPDIMVLGINPGSEGLYYQQKTQFGWGLNGSDMDGCHLILGNYFIDNGFSSWSNRNKWPFWNRLKDYFRDVKTGNPLDDESKFVVTNMSFFNSKKARNITNPLFYKSLPFSIDLIKILKPKQIVFLGGKGILDKLTRSNRNNRLFDMNYEIIKPRVCKGLFNGIPFLAVPHPSAYLKREERQVVIDCITNFMNKY